MEQSHKKRRDELDHSDQSVRTRLRQTLVAAEIVYVVACLRSNQTKQGTVVRAPQKGHTLNNSVLVCRMFELWIRSKLGRIFGGSPLTVPDQRQNNAIVNSQHQSLNTCRLRYRSECALPCNQYCHSQTLHKMAKQAQLFGRNVVKCCARNCHSAFSLFRSI